MIYTRIYNIYIYILSRVCEHFKIFSIPNMENYLDQDHPIFFMGIMHWKYLLSNSELSVGNRE